MKKGIFSFIIEDVRKVKNNRYFDYLFTFLTSSLILYHEFYNLLSSTKQFYKEEIEKFWFIYTSMHDSFNLKYKSKFEYVFFMQIHPLIILQFYIIDGIFNEIKIYDHNCRDRNWGFNTKLTIIDNKYSKGYVSSLVRVNTYKKIKSKEEMEIKEIEFIIKGPICIHKKFNGTHFNLFDLDLYIYWLESEEFNMKSLSSLNKIYKKEFTNLSITYKESYQEQFISDDLEFIRNYHTTNLNKTGYNYCFAKQLNEKEFGKCLLFINSSELSMMDVDLEFESNTEEDPQ